MATNKLVGQNYTTPDLVAKVTGQAKYAEDFKADGMLFVKLLVSPMPHAKVKRIDPSAALTMPGVKGILTADELAPPADSVDDQGRVIKANTKGEKALTNEPVYQGEPVLALAAISEDVAADAIEKIVVEWEPLPFVVDPVLSLKPGSPNARLEGNVWMRPPAGAPGADGKPAPPAPPDITELKWTDEEFAEYKEGRLPMGKAAEEWTVGNVEEGFKNAALVLDETFVTPNSSHQTLEPRSAMSYWQNGKVYIHCSTQSTIQTVASFARWLNMPPTDIVVISEYTGGGFGSKATGTISAVIPALLAKKLNAPVMMRITREDEHGIGGARPSVFGRVKAGFAKDGRILAIDMYVVCENGPYEQQGDTASTGRMVSLVFQPKAMRWRGVPVLTNTPPRRAQRAPGGMQGLGVVEPLLAKAAVQLGLDQLQIRKINAPAGRAPFGPPNAAGKQAQTTSAYVNEALDRGAELFKWSEKRATAGKRVGNKVRGVGVGVGTYVAGSIGFDGLFVIKPDGKMYVQSGIGNLGTESVFDVHRVAAEMMGMPWEKCEVTFGNTSKNLPWSCVSGGSQTVHAMTRSAHAAASNAIKKAQEIAAKSLGGKPEDYVVAHERVARKGGGAGMTLAQVAQKAIELGGVYDGHDLPQDINAYTKRSAAALAGQGLMGVAKDTYPRNGATMSFVASFAEVEVDLETGKYQLIDYVAVGDVGTVLHPRALMGQLMGGSMLGIGHAIGQKWVYDQHYGVPLAKRMYQTRPPSILDAPRNVQLDAVNLPDPETPVGARGVGEPPVGAGFCSVINALANAVGPEVFRRAPVSLDMILTAMENGGKGTTEPLTAHI